MSKLPLPANQRDQNKGHLCITEAFEIAVRVGAIGKNLEIIHISCFIKTTFLQDCLKVLE